MRFQIVALVLVLLYCRGLHFPGAARVSTIAVVIHAVFSLNEVSAFPPNTSSKTSSVATRNLIRSSRPIMDMSLVVHAKSQATLTQIIHSAQHDTGTEIQIVLVDRVQFGYSPKQMATILFNKWRLGPSNKNNGVLILAVLERRRVEIEIGKGLNQVMNAAWCAETLRKTAVPHFRQEQYGHGLVATTRAVAKRLRQVDRILENKETSQTIWFPTVSFQTILMTIVVGLFGFCVVVTAMDDARPLRKLPCPSCGASPDTWRYHGWRTTVPATDQNSGRRVKTGVCVRCGYTVETVRTIPQHSGCAVDSDGNVSCHDDSDDNDDAAGFGGDVGGYSDGGGGGADW